MGKSGKIGLGVAALVVLMVGLFVGFIVGNSQLKQATPSLKKTNTQQLGANTKAANFRVLLNNLFSQHVDLLAATVRARRDNTEQLSATKDALNDNSKALAAAIDSIYGDDARDKFYDIWHSQTDFFVQYSQQVKAKNLAAKNEEVDDLNEYADKMSGFISSLNPNLSKDAVTQLLTSNINLVRTIIDRYQAGDTSASYSAQAQARDQITDNLADSLATAIIQQKPKDFGG